MHGYIGYCVINAGLKGHSSLQLKKLRLTNTGQAVYVGERQDTLRNIELDHLESRLLDLSEKPIDRPVSSRGVSALRHHIHYVAEELRDLQI